jgi:hypothetical protein
LGSTNPPYNPKAVLQSSAGMALATVKPLVSAANILQLRKKATVTCSESVNNTPCNLVKGPCLFDLSDDPCEMKDLSAEHPKEMKELTELLSNYTATLVPQLNQPYDPVNADPARFNNVWSPWIDSSAVVEAGRSRASKCSLQSSGTTLALILKTLI